MKLGYALCLTTAIALVIAAPLATAASINVVQVTHNDLPEAEPSIAINPQNPGNVVAGWISGILGNPAGHACNFGVSFDSGKSWEKIGPVPGITNDNGGPWAVSGDPSVAFDKDGDAYFACGASDRDSPPAGVEYVSKSTDGGMTWGAPVVAFGPIKNVNGRADFAKISTNPANGDVYVVAQGIPEGFGIYFTRSTDHGVSFSSLVRIDKRSDGAYTDDPYAVAGVDPSVVYITYGAGSNANQRFSNYDQIFIAKSTDGGATFSPGQKLLDVAPLTTVLANFPQGLVDANMWSAVDRTSGEIYVNFVDYRNGDADVWLLRVRDTGTTFVSDGVTRVNDDPMGNGADQFYPFLSLAPNGRIDICFEDRRYAPGNSLLFTTCAHSSDGGATFTNVQVTTAGFDASNNFFIQDYEWQASTDRFVMPIFISDGFPGADFFGQEVFVARVPL